MTFVERYATNLTRWDVLVYFGRNPDASENVEMISRRVGRRPNVVVKELDDLAYLGILCSQKNGHGLLYELAPVNDMRRIVTRLVRHTDKAY
jgi:DNA-binding MarR family transcriptional regulator